MRILLFAILLPPIFGFGQAVENKPVKWLVKHNATAMMDHNVTFPTIQFALERKISGRFSTQMEIGVQAYPKQIDLDTTFIKDKGYKFKLEGRYYFQPVRGRVFKGLYTGLQFHHYKNEYNNTIDYYSLSDSLSYTYYDSFIVKKSKIGGRVIFGLQLTLGAWLWMDIYSGVGLESVKVSNKKREYDPAIHFTTDCLDVCTKFYDLSETSREPHSFTLGIRFGMALR